MENQVGVSATRPAVDHDAGPVQPIGRLVKLEPRRRERRMQCLIRGHDAELETIGRVVQPGKCTGDTAELSIGKRIAAEHENVEIAAVPAESAERA